MKFLKRHDRALVEFVLLPLAYAAYCAYYAHAPWWVYPLLPVGLAVMIGILTVVFLMRDVRLTKDELRRAGYWLFCTKRRWPLPPRYKCYSSWEIPPCVAGTHPYDLHSRRVRT